MIRWCYKKVNLMKIYILKQFNNATVYKLKHNLIKLQKVDLS